MNEDKMTSLLSNLDDDLIEEEIFFLMSDVECDMGSITRKANRKLKKYNRKTKWRKRLPYAAGVCLCLIGINVVYANDISQALKSFFNKTPVYSTMVDGKAYYLENSLVLNDNLTINSFMVSEGNAEMECTSTLDPMVLGAMTIIPGDFPDVKYAIGVYAKDKEGRYHFTFADCQAKSFNVKPFKDFDLLVGGKTYPITLKEAKSLADARKLAAGLAANEVGQVTVGANSIEKNGKQAVQLIASFKDKDMKLAAFGQPEAGPVKFMIKNLDDGSQMGSSSASETKEIYATDASGVKHRLTVPADVKVMPVTTFETDAVPGSRLTVKLPALLARYEKSMANVKINIPKNGEAILDQDVDLLAQKTVIKSIKRLSPTSAQLTFLLNTGTDKHVNINSFSMLSNEVKKISGQFSGDKATAILEFNNNVTSFNLDISWPIFVIAGDWTINMK